MFSLEETVLGETTSPGVFAGIRGIVFDCDGVILDSRGSNTWFYNNLRNLVGLGPMTEEEEEYVHTRHVYESLRRIMPGDYYEKALEARKAFDYRSVLPHLKLMPGFMDFLSWARSSGVLLGVNTSRTDTMDMVLGHLGLSGFFTPVVTSFKVTNPKPHPEGLHLVCEMWRLRPRDIVFVGDASVDEESAARAGVRFWSYGNPKLTADLHISSYRKLLAGLKRAARLGVFPAGSTQHVGTRT